MRSLPLAVACLLFASTLHAQDQGSATPVGDTALIFSVRTYSIADGLPHRRVTFLAQDDQGFLWAATPAGLVRFDGYGFRSYTRSEGLASDAVVQVWCDADGLLWVVHLDGNVDIFDPRTGQCASFARHFEGKLLPGMPERITDVAASDRGEVVFAQPGGLVRYRSAASGFQRLTVACEGPLNVDRVDDNGTIWCRCVLTAGPWAGNDLIRITPADVDEATGRAEGLSYPGMNTTITGHAKSTTRPPEEGLYALMSDGQEDWISSAGTLIPLDLTGRARASEQEMNGGLRAPISKDIWVVNARILRMRAGDSPWSAPVLYDIGALHPEAAHGVYDLLHDHMGHIWMATEFGLVKVSLHADRFQRWLQAPTNTIGLGRRVRGMAVIEGRLHVNTENEGYWVLDTTDGHVLSADTTGITRIALAADGQGGLWRSEQGRIRHGTADGHADPGFPTWFQDHSVWSLLPLRQGGLLIGGGNGWTTERKAREQGPMHHPAYPELDRSAIWHLGYDRRSRLWACTSTGLYQVSEEGAPQERWWSGADRAHDAEHYLPVDDIRHFHEDSAGIFWLATGTRGLLRWDPRTGVSRLIGTAEGMPGASIHATYADDQGLLWLPTDNGLVRYDPATELIKVYTTADGIASDEFNRIAHTQGPDGRMYFGGQNGITVVDPAELRRTSAAAAAPFLIDAVQVQEDGPTAPAERSVTVRDGAPIIMRPGDRYFTVDMKLLSLDEPALIRYAWRIDGIDNAWNVQREPHLRFTSLPYGDHVLRIKAMGADGQWNPQELVLPIVMVRPLYLRWWFIAACAMAAAGMVYVFIRYRVRRLNELLRMRDRIALDLHDEVGSDLSSIVLFSTVVRRQNEGLSDESGSMLQRIAQNSTRAMENMNDIVWSVNPGHDSLTSVFERMRAYAEPLCEAAGITPEWDVAENLLLRKLRMDDRKNLYLVFKEAMNNAVKHARATRITVRLKDVNGIIELEVADNGSGLPVEDRSASLGGNGLPSMRKRAEELNGELDLRSDASGTRLVLRFDPGKR